MVALVKRTTALEFGEIGNELMVYAGWSAVPARYFISGGVGGLSVFCFESDGDTNILAYLEQAGFKDLAQFEILRGAGTCRDVVQAKISLDLPWRDGT
ncbi:MAG: hypothetical protein RL093_418 [Pseudomonadota bacterium]